MANTDDSFFTENIVNINKKINLIILCANIVPVLFIAFTKLGLWYVPTGYAISIVVYDTVLAAIGFALTKSSKKVLQYVAMYLCLIAVSGFVFLLGMRGVIVITVSYAFAPILSCLYYNRKLTSTTTILNFLLTVLAYRLRASSVNLVISGVQTADRWFVENVPGVIVEFIFVFLITDSISRRTHHTFRRIMSLNADKDGAYRRLNEKNVEQFNLNKELQEKNEFIEKLNLELKARNLSLNEDFHRMVEFTVQCLANYDLLGGFHSLHVNRYYLLICKKVCADGFYTDILNDETISRYALAAYLHDIGKARLPQTIVNKIGKYSDEEIEIMKTHPMEGRKLLEKLPPVDEGKYNVVAKEMALYHHERWDGKGYPFGVSGESIPLSARIMAVVDALDSMLNPRLYKDTLSIDEALAEFEKEKGKQFEPCIADAVIGLKNEIIALDLNFNTNDVSCFDDELAIWRKYYPEFNVIGKGKK